MRSCVGGMRVSVAHSPIGRAFFSASRTVWRMRTPKHNVEQNGLEQRRKDVQEIANIFFSLVKQTTVDLEYIYFSKT